MISFTSVSTYLRHLVEKHKSKLPCNGDVFSLDRANVIYKCEKCNKTFIRKEHYIQHMKSKLHHTNNEDQFTDDENSNLENNKSSSLLIEADIESKESDLINLEDNISNPDQMIINDENSKIKVEKIINDEKKNKDE